MATPTTFRYRYFISYAIAGTGQIGRCDISRAAPIAEIADVEGIEKTIAQAQGRTGGVLVTGWQRFEDQP